MSPNATRNNSRDLETAAPPELVDGTADPAFTSDLDGRVLSWNSAAEEFFGRTKNEAVGLPCYTLIAGRDTFGYRFCSELCPVRASAVAGEPVRHFEMTVVSATDRQRVRVGVVVSRNHESTSVVHLLLPALISSDLPATASANDRPEADRLTPRETEVLALLAEGMSTVDIADRLFISPTTARSHIQNIMRKLDVHSRVAAVAVTNRQNAH